MDTPTDRALCVSLASTTCPACGGPKQRAHTFCSRDYYVLPKAKRNALYNPLGSGYAEAVVAAMGLLGCWGFITPEAGPCA